jgi:hypothetical protein
LTNENQTLTTEEQETLTEVQSSKSLKTWKPMRLTYTGEAKDVVQQGGGKLSAPGGDPGEAKKQTT